MLYSALEAFGYGTESFWPMKGTGWSRQLVQDVNEQPEGFQQTNNTVPKGKHV